MALSKEAKSIGAKVGLVALAFSFPAGLFLLNAPMLEKFDEIVQKPSTKTVDVDGIVDAKASQLAEIDMRILQARGEVLKFEEMRQAKLKELRSVYERLSALIHGSPVGQAAEKEAASK